MPSFQRTCSVVAYLVLGLAVSCGGQARDSVDADAVVAFDARDDNSRPPFDAHEVGRVDANDPRQQDARSGDASVRDSSPPFDGHEAGRVDPNDPRWQDERSRDASVRDAEAREGETNHRVDARGDDLRDGASDCDPADTEDAGSSLDGAADPLDVSATSIDATSGDERDPLEGATPDHGSVTSITITTARSTVGRGNVLWFHVHAIYSDGLSAYVPTPSLVSSNPAVVQIVDGRGIANSLGTATITATFGDLVATTEVTVIPNNIVSIAVRVRNRSPQIGQNCRAGDGAELEAIATMSDGSERNVSPEATWTSSDSSVMAVESRQSYGAYGAECISPGQAVISAVITNGVVDGGGVDGPLGNIRGELTAVVGGVPVVGYLLNGPAVLAPGSSAGYRVVALYADGRVGFRGLPAAALSSNPTVMSVIGYERSGHPNDGSTTITMVQALTAGSTVMSATYAGVQVPSLTVTVTTAELQ